MSRWQQMQLNCARWSSLHSQIWAHFPAPVLISWGKKSFHFQNSETKHLNQQEPTRTHPHKPFVVKITCKVHFGSNLFIGLFFFFPRSACVFTAVTYRHEKLIFRWGTPFRLCFVVFWKQRHKSCDAVRRSVLPPRSECERKRCMWTQVSLLPLVVMFGCMSPAGRISPSHSWLQSPVCVSVAVWQTTQIPVG